jgi:hypothetical protein
MNFRGKFTWSTIWRKTFSSKWMAPLKSITTYNWLCSLKKKSVLNSGIKCRITNYKLMKIEILLMETNWIKISLTSDTTGVVVCKSLSPTAVKTALTHTNAWTARLWTTLILIPVKVSVSDLTVRRTADLTLSTRRQFSVMNAQSLPECNATTQLWLPIRPNMIRRTTSTIETRCNLQCVGTTKEI